MGKKEVKKSKDGRKAVSIVKCPKCNYKYCIVDIVNRDYDEIKEEFYCLNCDSDIANGFLRQYIYDRLWKKISKTSNSIGTNQEENVAQAILDILNFDDDGNLSSISLLRKLVGLKEFKPGEIFDFQSVRKKVFEGLKNGMNK